MSIYSTMSFRRLTTLTKFSTTRRPFGFAFFSTERKLAEQQPSVEDTDNEGEPRLRKVKQRLPQPVKMPTQFWDNFLSLAEAKHLNIKFLRKESVSFDKAFAESRLPVEKDELNQRLQYVVERERHDHFEEHNVDPDQTDSLTREVLSNKFKSKAEKQVRLVVKKHKPLRFAHTQACLSYGLARAPQDHACLMRALHEICFSRLHDAAFSPSTVLDVGSGLGTSYWACQQTWPRANFAQWLMVDRSTHMNNTAQQLLTDPSTGRPYHSHILHRVSLIQQQSAAFELALSAFVLLDCADSEERLALVENMWHKTSRLGVQEMLLVVRYLLLVERPSHNGFKSLIQARDHLLAGQAAVDWQKLDQLFQKHTSLDRQLLKRARSSEFDSDRQRLDFLDQNLPASVPVPTVLPRGRLLAPCPHSGECGRMRADRVRPCVTPIQYHVPHFITGKGRSSVDSTSFCYVLFERLDEHSRSQPQPDAIRVISPVTRVKGARVIAQVCAHDGSCATVRCQKKSDGEEAYGKLKAAKHGQKLPLSLPCFSNVNRFN